MTLADSNCTIVIKSRDRISGTTGNYSVNIPEIKSGFYKCEILAAIDDLASLHELQMNWSISPYHSTDNDAFKTVAVIDNIFAKGVFYLRSNSISTVDIRFKDITTNNISTTLSEHVLMIHCQQVLL